MDMSQYRDLFISESRNHIEAFSELIVQLEHDAGNRSLIDELFRHAHSLKGMASTMQFDGIASLSHILEDQLSRIRTGELLFAPAMADLLLEGNDLLCNMVDAIEKGDDVTHDTSGLARRFSELAQGSEPPVNNPTTDSNPVAGLPSSEHSAQRHQFRQSDSFKSIRVKTELLDHLVAITGELITTHHILAERASRNGIPEMEQPIRHLASLVRDLRDEVFHARMLPFLFIAERFPRLVRDLARKQGKEVELRIEGGDCELDRGVLEEIAEPLVHILRNAVDHGLETPDERVAAGKPHNGTIILSVKRNKDHVDLTVHDDGRGMNPDFVREKAVERGVLTAEAAAGLTTPEILMLVCTPGFSTSDIITDISGRGVGMDAVKAAVHKLGGILAITSEPGKGSVIRIQIPLTVSIINVLMVRCGTLLVAFPINTIERTIELAKDDIIEQDGRKVCLIEGNPVPVKNLNRMLGQPLPRRSGAIVPALLARISGVCVALLADEIRGQQEIFIKPLGVPLSAMKWCSGGSVMGDGSVVFVVDLSALS